MMQISSRFFISFLKKSKIPTLKYVLSDLDTTVTDMVNVGFCESRKSGHRTYKIEQESLRHIASRFDLNWETQGWIWHWSTSNCFL